MYYFEKKIIYFTFIFFAFCFVKEFSDCTSFLFLTSWYILFYYILFIRTIMKCFVFNFFIRIVVKFILNIFSFYQFRQKMFLTKNRLTMENRTIAQRKTYQLCTCRNKFLKRELINMSTCYSSCAKQIY